MLHFQCVSASYSEATRVCHNQVPSTLPMCTVPPFRRFVRTMTGCIGADLGVTYGTILLSSFGYDREGNDSKEYSNCSHLSSENALITYLARTIYVSKSFFFLTVDLLGFDLLRRIWLYLYSAVRKDLSLEHGVDPCVPAALLHADSALWAQRPLASNGESTTLMDPCSIFGNIFISWYYGNLIFFFTAAWMETANMNRMEFTMEQRLRTTLRPIQWIVCEKWIINCIFSHNFSIFQFMVRYKPDFGMTVTYLCISGFCAEEDPCRFQIYLILLFFFRVTITSYVDKIR